MRLRNLSFPLPTMEPRSFHGCRGSGTGGVRNAVSPAVLFLLLLPLLPGCAAPSPSAEQEIFWNRLEDLCGQAFEGRVLEAPPEDGWWEAERFVMHVRLCGPEEIRVPLHVDDDRSRTWVVTRTGEGLRLKHDHRLEDGTPDASNTDYGGDTVLPGSVWRQEFPADEFSVEAVPARASQLWYLEIRPGETFVYGLRREETGLRYRVEFDLTRPVEPPPPPWGG
jgi:hypothetical protein